MYENVYIQRVPVSSLNKDIEYMVEVSNVPRKGILVLIVLLIVGIILIVGGTVLQNSYPFASSTAMYIIIPLIIIILGWGILILGIISGIYLMVKWSRKE